jgi:hypothetical protein
MPLPGASLEWEKGGLARFVLAKDDAVALISTEPSPPGSRIAGTLLEEPRSTVRIKVHACRRETEGTFRLEGRALDLTREMRARIVGLASELASGPD